MSLRRQLLLSVVDLEKYAVETFNDIYYSLTTSKRDNGKIKTDCIYGNGVVENQLVQNGNFEDGMTGWGGNSGAQNFSTFSVANGVLTQTFTSTPDAGYKSGIIVTPTQYRFNTYKDHYYLIFFKCKSNASRTWRCYCEGCGNFNNTSSTANTWALFKDIKKANTNKTSDYLTPMIDDATTLVNGDTLQFSDVNFIDLTLMFGTGNEPTSLSDHRIQALLNRGYIPYNAGTYKGTDIGLFSSEAYNLFSLNRELGTLSGYSNTTPRVFEEGKYYLGMTRDGYYYPGYITSYSISNNSLSVTNSNGGYGIAFPIKVLPNRQYAFEGTADNGFLSAVGFYDKDGVYISNFYGNSGGRLTTRNDTFTTPSNAYWAVILMYPPDTNTQYTFSNLCVHQTGTRTGYAPYPEWLKLNHFVPNTAGSVSDTYKDFVFSRNVGFVDLGSLTWSEQGGGFSATPNPTPKYVGSTSSLSNISCDKYQTLSLIDLTNGTLGISVLGNGNIWIKDSELTLANINSKLSNIFAIYELATPQTITMAKNCLNCVDLGTLTWAKETSNNGVIYFRTYGINNSIAIGENGVYKTYCNAFNLLGCINTTVATTSTFPDNSLTQGLGGYAVSIRKSEWDSKTADEVKSLLSGVYLFYETASPINEIASGVFTQKNVIYTPSAIQLDGALNAKNKLQITPQNYVITRNVWQYTFSGSDTFIDWSGSGFSLTIQINGMKPASSASATANVVWSLGQTTYLNSISGTSPEYTIAANTVDRVYIATTKTSVQLNSAVSGKSLYYELASPQTTTIKRKHLKAVDLSTLDFAYNSTDKAFYVQLTDMVNSTYYSKIFTPNYLGEIITTLAGMGDRHIAISNRWLYIKDLRYNTASAFKAAVAGQYLWYETTNEVDDMVNKASFENGGCIRACEFGWVENQQFIIPTISSTTTNGITITNNGDGTVTISGTASAQTTFTLMGNLSRPIPLGHKVLITNFANPNVSTYYMQDAYESNVTVDLVNTPYGFIKTKQGSDTILSPRIYIASGTAITTPQTVKVEYFDLTLAFGAGNEPTSINDWRIQYILNKGYMPTNTTGTYKYIDTEVLPSADMKVQQ